MLVYMNDPDTDYEDIQWDACESPTEPSWEDDDEESDD